MFGGSSDYDVNQVALDVDSDLRNEPRVLKIKNMDSSCDKVGKKTDKEIWQDGMDDKQAAPELDDADRKLHGKSVDRTAESIDNEWNHCDPENSSYNKDVNCSLKEGGGCLIGSDSTDVGRNKLSHTPDRSARKDIDDGGFSDSENERNLGPKDKDWKDGYSEDRSYKRKDRGWNEKMREQEGSKDSWRRWTRQEAKDGNDFETHADRRHEQERMDGGNFHGRSGYRKDSRTRLEGGKGSSSFGIRNESSDSIEIRPNRNFDFDRRPDAGLQPDSSVGIDKEKWAYHPKDISKSTSNHGKELQDRFQDDGLSQDQSSSRGILPSNSSTTPSNAGVGQNCTGDLVSLQESSQGSGSFPRDLPQGPKGSRPRGARGKSNSRDAQIHGLPMPIMNPPFGLALPPGSMQPIGPNMPPPAAAPIGPGAYIPPFQGHIIWPGGHGIDMNVLAGPNNLPPMPPHPLGSRFAPHMGVAGSHPMHLNQPNFGRNANNTAGQGFNRAATPTHESPGDKAPSGWTSSRSGPSGKAPSRGEQNDYSQNFVDTGMRPQNFIRELELTSVVEDYPKLRELIQRKDEIVSRSATPPMYYKCDLREHELSVEFFGTKFDVILVDPPWEEYAHRAPGITDHIEYWTFEQIMELKIEAIADTPSFIFLWVGDSVGLEQGRQCLRKWGFRRCEDICWVKTNKKNATPGLRHDSRTLFQHSKEHCLMGIKGTVRRSTDGHIIHANIDTDVIIAEEPPDGSMKKPDDMYKIIEHFALGRRRLELFGEDHNIRSGWLTLGKGLSSSNFNKEVYVKNFADKDGIVYTGSNGKNPGPEAPHLVVTTPEIENLRPKSPPQKNQQHQSLPLLSSDGSNSRRLSGNLLPSPLTVINPESTSPAPWAPPVSGFGMPDVGYALPDSTANFDASSFNPPPYMRTTSGDHADFEPHRSSNPL